MEHDSARARHALAAYGLTAASLSPIEMGNINDTYRVDAADGPCILQRVNPIFAPEVHHDIEAVTRLLAAAGLTTPRLLPTAAGALWHTDADGGVWRLQTFIAGRIFAHVDDPRLCHAAGALLGRFHRVLGAAGPSLRGTPIVLHDTASHLRGLEAALEQGRQHPAYEQVAPLADCLRPMLGALPSFAALPQHMVHGDAKLNNVIFAEGCEARALIDLDTVGRLALPLELGDAWRSWCNPAPNEAGADSGFSLELFRASVEGYAAGVGAWLTADEVEALDVGVEAVALSLATRFARDALEERYFGWDRSRYPAAWVHHLARARAQLQVARAYCAQKDAARALLRAAWRQAGAV